MPASTIMKNAMRAYIGAFNSAVVRPWPPYAHDLTTEDRTSRGIDVTTFDGAGKFMSMKAHFAPDDITQSDQSATRRNG